MSDTIAAIATARGQAALAIIRLSGPTSFDIAEACFKGASIKQAPSHTAHVGYIVDAKGQEIDQVVLTIFKSPRSVTGEDVVEISCHGGDFASRLILEVLVEKGARLAGPGEFTQRSFLNGKVDLAQAEAVADLIHASSSQAHRVSLQHIQGRYSEQLQKLRAELLELCAYIELELDFSEEDVAFADINRLQSLLDQIAAVLNTLLGSYPLGELIRDGIRVVIAGRPNAGKSTLLNALLGRDRAIVSPIPGTTRDEVEAEAEIGGMRYRFVDTAGLREASDVIEAEGVRRAKQSVELADLVLYVYDAVLGLTGEEREWLSDVAAKNPDMPVIVVANKIDALKKVPVPAERKTPVLYVSAESARSDSAMLMPIIHRMQDVIGPQLEHANASPIVMNQRHRGHLEKANEAVQSARVALQSGHSGDTLALDLRVALHELGQITGEITNEDVLDQIFSRFCIGK